jgi:predicted phosphoadenosine phosphosulfate sulfurtransferase
MKIYLPEDVLTAARARVRWVFREFQHVYVGFSGGKDSTVVLNLALEAAEEMGRLPVPVVFLDQEAEWQSVIDYVRIVMADPRVSPRWLQVPFKLFNATSAEHPWLYCWDPAEEARWIRPKEACSIKTNVYGTDRFHKMFAHFLRYHHISKPAVYLAGVRCEESPSRMMGLTTTEVYKGETWGRGLDARRNHFTFYPIYDWSISDVWKAIHDHGWAYTKLYDYMYQYGVPVQKMRVSNLHHETAVRSLFYCQEIESETWEKVQQRLAGINTAGQLRSDFYGPDTLPPMFTSWYEYRDYLLDNLIADPVQRRKFADTFAAYDSRYDDPDVREALVKTEIATVLVNDIDYTKLRNFGSSHFMDSNRLGSKTVGGAY